MRPFNYLWTKHQALVFFHLTSLCGHYKTTPETYVCLKVKINQYNPTPINVNHRFKLSEGACSEQTGILKDFEEISIELGTRKYRHLLVSEPSVILTLTAFP